jgi:hypothetical protein
MLTRRKLLRAGAVTAFSSFAAACGPLSGADSRAPVGPVPKATPGPVARPIPVGTGITSLSMVEYKQAIGTSFRMVSVRRAPDLELIAVKDLSVHPKPADGKPASAKEQLEASALNGGEVFALTFVGPSPDGVPLQQDVYEIRHARLGWGPMLLVPSGTRADGLHYYQALINHQVPTNR